MILNNTRFNAKRTRHAEEVISILEEYLQNEKMCDIVIIADIDGTRIPAHRILLSACSSYFSDHFTNAPSEEKEVHVAKVSGSVLKALVEYCYIGDIEIRKDNVENLKAAACLLQMYDVSKVCQDFLLGDLRSSSELPVAHIVGNDNCKDIYETTMAFVYQHFMQLCKTDEFLQLDIEVLSKIIESDDLVVDSEESVFNSCVSWINYDCADREQYFHQLLEMIRLPLLTLNFIKKHVKPLCKSSESLQLYIEADEWHHEPKTTSKLVRRSRKLPQMQLSKESQTLKLSDEILLVIGAVGNDHYLSFKSYNDISEEWSDSKRLLTCDENVVCAVLGDSLLIVGDDESNMGTVNSYNFTNQKLTAHKPLNTPRRWCDCAVLDGKLYILGGKNSANADLNSVERWDPKVQTWENVASMSVSRVRMRAVALGKYLYAVGGFIENSVERYDPSTNQWTSRASMIMSRYDHGLAADNNYLYVVGGGNTNTVERYNPVDDKWTLIGSISSASHHVGCGFLGDRLMAVCGSYWTRTSTVEEYDSETDKWILKKPLRRTITCPSVVKIPRKYIP